VREARLDELNLVRCEALAAADPQVPAEPVAHAGHRLRSPDSWRQRPGRARRGRAGGTVHFPAKSMLVGAMNPWKLKYHG
jgi:hypothetical protein